MSTLIIHTLNGISFGMLLFLLASGLTLIFGLMRIMNLAHGGYYLLGVYIGFTVMKHTGSYFLATLSAGLSIAVIGIFMERFFLRGLHRQVLAQCLLTIGFTFVFTAVELWIWGGIPCFISKPALFSSAVFVHGVGFPSYRLFVIVVGLLIALALWFLQEGTRIGARVRAAVDDEEMARGVGIDVNRIFLMVFGVGAFLAGVCGVLGGAFVGAVPGGDFEILLLTLIVIIVGGVGSLKGALIGSLIVGLIDNFGKVFFPELARFTIYAPMVIILVLKPSGLFGTRD